MEWWAWVVVIGLLVFAFWQWIIGNGNMKRIIELEEHQKYLEQQNMELKRQNDWLLAEFARKTGIKPLPGRGEAP